MTSSSSSSSSSSHYKGDLGVYQSVEGYSKKIAVDKNKSETANNLLLRLKASKLVQNAIKENANSSISILNFENGFIDVYSRLGGRVRLTYTTENAETIDLDEDNLRTIKLSSDETALGIAKKILELFSKESNPIPLHSTHPTPPPVHPGCGTAPPITIHNESGDPHTIPRLLEHIRQMEETHARREAGWRNDYAALANSIRNSPAMQTVPPDFYERFLKGQEEISRTLQIIQRLLENLGTRNSGSSSSSGSSGDEIDQIQQLLGVLGKELEIFRKNGPLQLARIEELDKKLKAALEVIERLTTENSQLRLENSNIAQYKKTIEDLTNELSGLRDRLGKLAPLEAENLSLRNVNQNLITQYQSLQTTMQELGDAHVKEIATLHAAIEALKVQLSSAQLQNKTDAQTIASLTAENEQLRKQLEENERLLPPLQEANQALKEENAHLRQQISTNEEAIRVNTAALDSNKDEINSLKNDIIKIQAELKIAKNQIKSLTEEIATLKAENLALKKPILKSTALSTENESLKRSKEELNKRLEESEAARNKLELKNGRLLEELTNARRVISEQKALIEKLENELLVVKKNSDEQNRAKISKLEERIASLEAENHRLTEADAAKDARIHELEQNQNQIAELQDEIERLKLVHSEEIAKIHAEYDARIAVFNEKEKKAELKITELSERLQKLLEELELLRSQKPRSSSEIRESVSNTVSIETYQLAQREHEIQMADKQEAYDSLFLRYEQIEKIDLELLAEIDRQKDQITALQRSLTDLQNQTKKDSVISALQAKIQLLQKVISEKETQLTENASIAARHRSQIEQIRQQYRQELEEALKEKNEALKNKQDSELQFRLIQKSKQQLDERIETLEKELASAQNQLKISEIENDELRAEQGGMGKAAERAHLKAALTTKNNEEIVKQLETLNYELEALTKVLQLEKQTAKEKIFAAQQETAQAIAKIRELEEKIMRRGNRRTKSLTDATIKI